MTLDVEPADAVLAIGVFDYVDEPSRLLARLKELTRRELIASFPRAGTWQGVLRRAWLRLQDCPVRYYEAAELGAAGRHWTARRAWWSRSGETTCSTGGALDQPTRARLAMSMTRPQLPPGKRWQSASTSSREATTWSISSRRMPRAGIILMTRKLWPPTCTRMP